MTKINNVDSHHVDNNMAAYIDDDVTVATYVEGNMSASVDHNMAVHVDDDVTTFSAHKMCSP